VPREVCVTKTRCVPRTVCRKIPVDPGCCPQEKTCAAPAEGCVQ
jgi:hypothetical protein